MSQTQPSPTVAPTHRMVIPWGRVRGLRRRLTQTVFALLPLILLAIGVHPAVAGWTPIASSISGSRAKTVCVSRRLRPLTLPHGMTIRWVGATVGEGWVWLIGGSD